MLPTAYLDVTEIFADEFSQGLSYRNWRPKGTPDWLFIYTMEGKGRLQGPGGEEWDSSPGDGILYSPGAWQQYATHPAPGRWHLIWARFRPLPHWRPTLDWPLKWKGMRLASMDEPPARRAVVKGMRRVVESCRGSRPLAGEFGLNALEEVLLRIRASLVPHPFSRPDARVLRAVALLAAGLREPFSMARLASGCGLSASHLAHLFKSKTGTTPQRMHEENRLRHAARLLLSTELTVGEVAEEVGYENPFYFSLRFRRLFGKSPSGFRRSGLPQAAGRAAL